MQLIVGVAVPLLVFLALCGCFWFLLTRAARDPSFKIAEIFRDDATGKVSMTQILKGGGFVFHTVGTIIVIATIPADALGVLAIYGGTWGPTAMGLEFIKRKWPTPGADGK
jgi:hypothetical protein